MAVDRAFVILEASGAGKLTTLTTAVAGGSLFGVGISTATVQTASVGGRHFAALVVPIGVVATLRAAMPGTPAGWWDHDVGRLDAADAWWWEAVQTNPDDNGKRAVVRALRAATATVAP